VTTGSRRVRGGGVNTVVLAVLRSPARMLVQGRLCALRFAGRRTGTVYTLPVEYTRDGDRIVVLAGRGRTKSWWHNFLSPHPVRVWLDGRWQPGTATVARSGHPHRTDLLATYRSTHPRVPAGSDDPLVPAAHAAAWNRHAEGSFSLRVMPGGHFFHKEHKELFFGELRRALGMAGADHPAATR